MSEGRGHELYSSVFGFDENCPKITSSQNQEINPESSQNTSFSYTTMGMNFFNRTRKFLARRKLSKAKGDDTSSNHEEILETSSGVSAGGARSISEDDNDVPSEDIEPIIIVGAGIVGLTMALALNKHCGMKVNLFEQVAAFHDDVGAGMGCYPNGLRVIQDISPDLLDDIQNIGFPYLLRRYEVRFSSQATTTWLHDQDASDIPYLNSYFSHIAT